MERGREMGFGGDDFFGTPLSLGQAMFMAEEEGVDDMVDTPNAKFNAAMKEVRKQKFNERPSYEDVTYEVNEILQKHGIYPSQLTKAQIRRIEKAVE